ncbi:MAG: methylated-DNA--[protein]-cysteine S-methyltransferase [Bacilli bacterium]|nr:methylated-DNA--[protein]-cysteine S-methyltransferase [Bacilli bacterium]
MMVRLNEDLLYQIFSIVDEIPYGKVATYGQIARLTGHEKNARLVGKAMSLAQFYGNYPCHRVVNHQGRLAPNFTFQRELLLEEGISFKENGCVDLTKFGWKID